jgi:hypothetical protein
MSKQSVDHALSSSKRKRACAWPFATISTYEQAIELLAKDEIFRELSPPKECRIHSSTEARGKGVKYERRLWVKNDRNAWHIAKIRQHAQDATKTIGKSGLDGGLVSSVNNAFTQLLRHIVRGGEEFQPVTSRSALTQGS